MRWGLLEQLTLAGVVLGSMYALLGVSFGVIYSTTRIFHLAHSAVYAVAAYAAVLIAEATGVPLVLAVLVGLLAGIALGVGIEVFGYEPVRKRGATLLALFIVSLGINVAFPNLLQIGFGPENRVLPGFSDKAYSLGDATFTRHDVVVVVIAWLLIAATLVFIERTQAGRAITAVRTNATMAAAVGINKRAVYIMVFAIGSSLVAAASLLETIDAVATPTMGLQPTLTGFIAAFLGGVGSHRGAALGGLLLGLVTSWSALFLRVDYGPVVVFGAMFLVLLIRPEGLLGKKAV